MWTFSGGFRTWVKMSLVRTSGKSDEAVEFRQEVFMSKLTHKMKIDFKSINISIYVGSFSPLW